MLQAFPFEGMRSGRSHGGPLAVDEVFLIAKSAVGAAICRPSAQDTEYCGGSVRAGIMLFHRGICYFAGGCAADDRLSCRPSAEDTGYCGGSVRAGIMLFHRGICYFAGGCAADNRLSCRPSAEDTDYFGGSVRAGIMFLDRRKVLRAGGRLPPLRVKVSIRPSP